MHSSKATRRSPNSGFTLIELLVVIAIIGILIALLLPSVRKVRNAALDKQASDDLLLVGKAEVAFHGSEGTYSEFLATLKTLPGDIQSGEADGHRFSILSSSREAFVAQSTPIEPGKTGSKTCKIDQTLSITCQ